MRNFNYYQVLKENTIFKHADYSTLISVIAEDSLSSLSFSQDEEICSPEKEEVRIGIVLSGSAYVCSSDDTRKVVLKILTAGTAFGFANLYTDSPFPTRIYAKNTCKILFVKAEAVRALIDADMAVRHAYLRLLNTKIVYLNKRIAAFTAGSAERRLSLFLADNEQNGVCSLAISMRALSESLDIGRASLYRAFDRLVADGFIERHGKDIILKNKSAMLEKYIH